MTEATHNMWFALYVSHMSFKCFSSKTIEYWYFIFWYLQVHSENGPSLSYLFGSFFKYLLLCFKDITCLRRDGWLVFFNISVPAWLNNCVGHFNHRYFFCYCLFMTLGCVYCSISGRNLFLDAYNALEVRLSLNLHSTAEYCWVTCVLSCAFLLHAGCLSVWGLYLSDWHCLLFLSINTWGWSWLLLLLPKRLKHLDVEKQGVPVTGMAVLIGLLPSGQVQRKHSTTMTCRASCVLRGC